LFVVYSIYSFIVYSCVCPEAQGYYNHTERILVYSIVSSAEANKVVKAIKEIDKSAFINLIKTQQLLGRFYRRREE